MLVVSERRSALISEFRGAPEPALGQLLRRLAPVDLVLVEGFKRERLAKIEVFRAAAGKPPLFPDDPDIVALATDDQAPSHAAARVDRRYRRRRRSRACARRTDRGDAGAARGPVERRPMAQLSPDAFRRANAPATLEEVARLIADRTPVVVGTERLGLADADGRVLAENLMAPLDLPGFDNAAVDGYAVAHADLNADAETVLPVDARIAAGDPGPAALRRGAAARIFTGAPLPGGADTVFMQEDVRLLDDGRVALPAGLAAGANARPRGEDIARGALALSAGQRLDPRHIALAAALGQAELSVRRPSASRCSRPATRSRRPANRCARAPMMISNRSALIALLRRRGCRVADYGVLRDDRAAIESRLRQAAGTSDLVITSGGVSVGEEDHVRKAIEAAGALTFWRLAIKPGRPVAMGVLDGVPFVGLPGNPVAVFIAFAFVARPLIAALGGEALRPPAPVQVECGFDYRKKAGRREFVRARLVHDAGSDLTAKRHPVDGAALITSLTQTDGLVVLPETLEAVRVGDRVEFLSYEQIW